MRPCVAAVLVAVASSPLDAQVAPQVAWARAGHDGFVRGVAIAPDGQMAASVAADGVLKFWTWPGGEFQGSLAGAPVGLTSVVFSPEGSRLAAGGADGRVYIWSLPGKELLFSVRPVTGGGVWSVAFAPDGLTFGSAGADGRVKFHGAADGAPTGPILEQPVNAYDLAFSPDGGLLATGGDGSVYLWALPAGDLLSTIEAPSGSVYAVAISPGGDLLASAGIDRTIRLWRLPGGEPAGEMPAAHSSAVRDLAFSPAGNLLASGAEDNTARLWNLAGGEPRVLRGHTGNIYSLAFSREGTVLLTGSADGTARTWRVSDGAALEMFNDLRGQVVATRFSPDGQVVASAGRDNGSPGSGGIVKLWRAADGSLIRDLGDLHGPPAAIAFSPDGGLLASPADNNTVRLYRPADGSIARTLPNQGGSVTAVAFSPDGTLLAVGRSAVSPPGVRLHNPGDGALLRELEETNSVNVLAFSRAGDLLAAGSALGVHIWSTADWTHLWRLNEPDTSGTLAVAFSPDGQYIAQGTRLAPHVRIWRLSDGVAALRLIGHDTSVYALAYSPDGMILASGGDRGEIRLWSGLDYQLLRTYTRETGISVRSIDWSPDNRLFAYGRFDGALIMALHPFRQEILPNSGCNAGGVSVRVITPGFPLEPGTEIVLLGEGVPVIEGREARVAGEELLTATLDLEGAPPGPRDVVVTRPDGATRELLKGFTVIEAPGAPTRAAVSVTTRDHVLRGRPFEARVSYSNVGCIDGAGSFLWISVKALPDGGPFPVTVDAATRAPPDLEPPTDPSGLPLVLDFPDRTLIPLYVPFVPSSGRGSVKLHMSCPPMESDIDGAEIEAWMTRYTWDVEGGFSEAFDCLGGAFGFLGELLLDQVIPNECIEGLVTRFVNVERLMTDGSVSSWRDVVQVPDPSPSSWMDLETLEVAGDCIGELVPLGRVWDVVKTGMELKSKLDRVSEIFDCAQGMGAESQDAARAGCVGSLDPNEIAGPHGVGAERFLRAGEPLPYTIYFENKAEATAPAHEVVITDRLDAAVCDLDSFEFGPVGFGSRETRPAAGPRSFETEVDLRPGRDVVVRIRGEIDREQGIVSWRFTSIDPLTGLPPEDPFGGFLPPNVTSPEGEGNVHFTLRPRAGLGTGAVLRNAASIVFDFNPPIATNEWTNTIDASAPASRVEDLPGVQEAASFTVRWSGEDPGAGILDYTVLVAEDGGPFLPWMVQTALTGAPFHGTRDRTYRFFSIARDALLHVEAPPADADTVTTILAECPTEVCGGQLPGDLNQDLALDISDAVALLFHLFAVNGAPLPCGGGALEAPGNRLLLDGNGDRRVDLTDAVHALNHLFLGGPGHVLGHACVRLESCPATCEP